MSIEYSSATTVAQRERNGEREPQLESGNLCVHGERKLLIVSRERLEGNIEAVLEREGWKLVYVTENEEIQSLNRGDQFLVGLVVLPDFHDVPWVDQCRQFIATVNTFAWIGAVNRDEIEYDALQRFILNSLHDFQVFPLDPDRLSVVLGHACGMGRIELMLYAKSAPTFSTHFGLVGQSAVMLKLYHVTKQAAKVNAPVLILGNTGTGKEHIARGIHANSTRASGPFVALNCCAIPLSLLQAELFGHEKGAFTGADQRRVGHLEAANGGTLFLDEIGEMPLEAQVSLLRFLEDKEVTRLGGANTARVDVRVIAATNRDLTQCVDEKTFRSDLYYRLAVLTVRTPDLNERKEDIKDLVYHFLAQANKSTQCRVVGVTDQALEVLRQYEWPGNVRELRSCIVRATIACSKGYISAKHLDISRPPSDTRAISLQDARVESEKQTLRHTLTQNGWNVSRAARDLGVSRMTLYRLLDRHGIARKVSA